MMLCYSRLILVWFITTSSFVRLDLVSLFILSFQYFFFEFPLFIYFINFNSNFSLRLIIMMEVFYKAVISSLFLIIK